MRDRSCFILFEWDLWHSTCCTCISHSTNNSEKIQSNI